jgi:hypothetical protein
MPKPDITYRIAPEDYERAIEADGERWKDERDAPPVWQGRRAWRLMEGVSERVMYRFLAFSGNLLVPRAKGAA